MDYKRTFGSGDSTIKLTLYPQPGESNVVGTLISKRFPHEVYLMQWADDRLSAGGEFCYACTAAVDGICAVMMRESLIASLRLGDGLAEMVLLHELGHYVHGDVDRAKAHLADDERVRSIQQGKVQQEELDADAFAAEYLGKNAVASALTELKQLRTQKYKGKEEWEQDSVNIGIQELELRISSLRHIAG